EFTVATDYDIEGEVIGLMCVLHACKQKDAHRMKFSTLTKSDLIKAYEQKSPTLDWGQALAGKTRHELDWYYGINLSRALSSAIRKAGQFKVLSSGRVQGPALKILVDKEKEISAFTPEPFIEIYADLLKSSQTIRAQHKDEKFFDIQKGKDIFGKIKETKSAIVDSVSRREFTQKPPVPFDLTTLQLEAHRVLKITPKVTLSLAQDLYIAGVISYPRTSSQKLPKELGYKTILSQLQRQPSYKEVVTSLLQKPQLKPHEGKKTDDAHPAIYPTGNVPDAKITQQQFKLYDLIVRRFLATFADDAKRETLTVQFDIAKEPFVTKGSRTVVPGWHTAYGKYAIFEEVTLPDFQKGEDVPIEKLFFEEKETKPPKRYTASSIIKELEKQGLGTKATRAAIVENLYDRGYVNEKSIQATQIGISTITILEKYCPKIVDAKLTRDIEDEMDEIRKNKIKPEKVLDDARHILQDILDEFTKKELDIGKELLMATRESRDVETYVGMSPKTQTRLRIMKGKYGYFIASADYPEVKETYPLPSGVKVKPNVDELDETGWPTILVKRPKGKWEKHSINPDAREKQVAQSTEKVPGEGETCDKCGKGTMQRRKSFYGEFLGCSNYPKCKNAKPILKKKE
ncbi:MAG: DNA topoisomerase I, partial [Candidatus Woesearchaeota archaeon]